RSGDLLRGCHRSPSGTRGDAAAPGAAHRRAAPARGGEGHHRGARRRSTWRAPGMAGAAGGVRRGDADRGSRNLRLPAGGVMKTRILGVAALLAVVAATLYALFGVPADLNQGDAQRIMYPHVSSAWLAYLSFGVTALAGLGWLV